MTCLRREDLDPAVVADDPVSAHEDCPPGTDGDAGVLPAELGDLDEVGIAKAVPSATKGRVDNKEPLAVGPEPANVYPPVAHKFSIPSRACERSATPSIPLSR